MATHPRGIASRDEGEIMAWHPFHVILLLVVTLSLAAYIQLVPRPDPAPAIVAPPAELQLASYDGGSDGDREWVRLVLLHGLDTPYAVSAVRFDLVDPLGAVLTQDSLPLCESPVWDPGPPGACANPAEADTEWDVGAALYLPCQGAGRHDATLTVGATLITRSVTCDGAP